MIFDTPGTPGGESIVERFFFESKQPLCELDYKSSLYMHYGEIIIKVSSLAPIK